MKKLITLAITVASLLIPCATYAAEYPGLLIITEADNEVVVGADANGYTFRFINLDEDWYVGDLVAVIFDDNETEYITDDIVLSTRYAGYLDLYERR